MEAFAAAASATARQRFANRIAHLAFSSHAKQVTLSLAERKGRGAAKLRFWLPPGRMSHVRTWGVHGPKRWGAALSNDSNVRANVWSADQSCVAREGWHG